MSKQDKTTKKMIRFFSIVQYEKEADFLRQEHKNGWKLSKVSGIGVYEFEACEPEDVVYQLDYCQTGNGDKTEYIKMFEDCGWEYLSDYSGYSYFRKKASEMNGDEKIFCDNESRVDMMNRIVRARLLPVCVIFLCVIIPCFYRVITGYSLLSIPGIVCIILVALYVLMILMCTASYCSFAKRMKKKY